MIDTAGLKCAPLMGPTSAMSVASTATVAAVFANNATARFPPARRSAMIPEPITVEVSSIDPRPSATSARRIMSDSLAGGTALADLTQPSLQRHGIERLDRKTRKELDSRFKLLKRPAERKRFLGIAALGGRGVRNPPVCGHGLSRPDRADFTGCVVANRKDKINGRRPRRGELIPALAAKILRRQIHALEDLDRHWMHLALGEASRTEAVKLAAPPVIDQRFRKDAARGVAGAQKQYAVDPLRHRDSLSRHAACGFPYGCLVLNGDGRSAVIEDRRIFAVDRDVAERVKGLPRNPGRIGDPVLVRPGVAAGLLVLLNQLRVGSPQLRAHTAQFIAGVDLKAQVIDTDRLAMGRDCEVHSRVLEHPFGVIGLPDARPCGKQRRIELDGFVEVVDADVHVKAF